MQSLLMRTGANPEKGGRLLRNYELMLIAQPGLDEEGLNNLVARMQQVIVDNKGEVAQVEHMGRRKLAYPIKKLHEGYYVLFHTSLERATIPEVERSLKLSEDVLRHMLVLVDEEAQ